jgi:hypothetical protein
MGNEFNSSSDIRTEHHTDAEEQPLNTQNTPSSDSITIETLLSNPDNNNQHCMDGTLPSGWKQRMDHESHKYYYMDHNNRSTKCNPPNTITKIGNKSIIIHNESTTINQLSDCWDIENPASNPYIIFNNNLSNTISVKTDSNTNRAQWISVFGTKIVTKGEYKRWQIKILPNTDIPNNVSRNTNKAVKCMIGVVDIDSISAGERGNAIQSAFWLLPRIGYCFGGEKGRKYHIDKKGKSYGHKYKVGDTVTVELNRTNNRFIMHNDLRFYTNENVNGLAFNVDNDRNYVLAVALCGDKYHLQIYD